MERFEVDADKDIPLLLASIVKESSLRALLKQRSSVPTKNGPTELKTRCSRKTSMLLLVPVYCCYVPVYCAILTRVALFAGTSFVIRKTANSCQIFIWEFYMELRTLTIICSNRYRSPFNRVVS